MPHPKRRIHARTMSNKLYCAKKNECDISETLSAKKKINIVKLNLNNRKDECIPSNLKYH